MSPLSRALPPFGAIGSAYGGLFNSGHIDFKDVLRGALSGAVTAGVLKEVIVIGPDKLIYRLP